jgi:dTDP-4-dehydrorhamnose reductase
MTQFDLRFHRIADRLGENFFHGEEPVCAIVCAAICEVDRCAREPEATRWVNVQKTRELFADLTRLGARTVFTSTSWVFDGEQGAYREDDPVSPTCEYGRQKVAVEEWLRETIPDALIYRLDKLVGRKPHPRNLFTQWVQQVEREGLVRCIAGQFFSPVALGDAADGMLMGCERGLRGVYHLGGPECVRRDELAQRFLQAWGREARIVSLPLSEFGFADARPLRTCLNSDKLQSAVSWRPTPLAPLMAQFLGELSFVCGA